MLSQYTPTETLIFGNDRTNYYGRMLKFFTDQDGTSLAYASRPDGNVLKFTQAGGVWSDAYHMGSQLVANGAGWTVNTPSGEVENYNATGRLSTLADRSGAVQTLTYTTAGALNTVSDDSGRVLTFLYGSNGLVSEVDLPDGGKIYFSYTNGNLSTVQYPDGNSKNYFYDESAYSQSSLTGLLTGSNEETGVRVSTIYYDAGGRAYKTVGSDSSNLESADFTYATYNSYNQTAIDHTTAGADRTMAVQPIDGKLRVVSVQQSCGTCTSATAQYQYDAGGYPSSFTDFNGHVTNYTYDDTRGLETQRIEVVGTTAQRTTNTVWDANFRVPDQRSVVNAGGITEALTNWVYNTRGQVSARCEVDPAISGASSYICGSSTNAPVGVRQWSYTYCEQAGVTAGTCPLVGQTLGTDGPRTDVSDVTTYAYYQATDLSGCATLGGVCHYLGDLQKVTNALGQITTYVSYDRNGHVTRMQDANGVYTDMTYHPRGWLLTRTVRANSDGTPNASSDATTTFAYDNVGNVTQITQPDGAYLSYGYDDAHRLTDITDNVGDHIHYTLDAAGNRTNESTYDPSSSLKRSLSRQYDQLDHLLKALNASSVAVQTYQNPADAPPSGTTYTNGYDGNGNAIYSADANSVGTEQQYDPLNRLVKTLQDHAGTGSTKDTATQYAYDARDNLRSVTDPNNLVTNYSYDGLNNLTNLSNPDTGNTAYTYDDAGNRATQTDANGITATYSYDALDRLTGIAYPASSLNIAYAYDVAATGCYNIGRLTQITDSSGSTTYCYDLRGNVLSKVQITGDITLTTGYTYTLADRLASITYPSGALVTYGRDSVGRITSVTYQPIDGTAQTVVSNVSYYPFGPANMLTFGNGRTLTKSYDQNYAIDSVASSDANGLAISAGVDPLGNLVHASNAPNANPPTRSYAYDPLYRLTGATDASSNVLEGYTYDATGDRLSKTYQGSTDTYAYTSPLTSHRLQGIDGVTRSYDANGNTTQSNGNAFIYDDRNRLIHAAGWSYDYNGRGERVLKQLPGPWSEAGLMVGSIFGYSPTGLIESEYSLTTQCLGHSTPSGCHTGAMWRPDKEYIWADGVLVGVSVIGDSVYYVETDQLGTPRSVILPGETTAADAVVWTWDYFGSSFGEDAPNEDPGNTGTTFTFNLRFPGQYFDAETGLNYNYFRDYEPGTGRYVESDPIGLGGGRSTYSYANNKPTMYRDRDGLLYDNSGGTRSWQQTDKILNLLNLDCTDCVTKGCYWCELRPLLNLAVLTTEIKYQFVDWDGDKPTRICGVFVPGNPYITITSAGEMGYTPNTGLKCARCPTSTVFHELLHVVGLDHPGGVSDPDNPNDPVYKQEHDCADKFCNNVPPKLPWLEFGD